MVIFVTAVPELIQPLESLFLQTNSKVVHFGEKAHNSEVIESCSFPWKKDYSILNISEVRHVP